MPTCPDVIGLLRHHGKLAELLSDVWLSLANGVVLLCDKIVSLWDGSYHPIWSVWNKT